MTTPRTLIHSDLARASQRAAALHQAVNRWLAESEPDAVEGLGDLAHQTGVAATAYRRAVALLSARQDRPDAEHGAVVP